MGRLTPIHTDNTLRVSGPCWSLVKVHTPAQRVQAARTEAAGRYLLFGRGFLGETRNAGTWPPPLVTLAKPVALRRVR